VMQVAKSGKDVLEIKESAVEEAKRMADEDVKVNMRMGKYGAQLFNDNDTVMTHCNAGALATVGYGTALGVISATKESGKKIKVIESEKRRVMKDSRLDEICSKIDVIYI